LFCLFLAGICECWLPQAAAGPPTIAKSPQLCRNLQHFRMCEDTMNTLEKYILMPFDYVHDAQM
jgi:hypothetical protein